MPRKGLILAIICLALLLSVSILFGYFLIQTNTNINALKSINENKYNQFIEKINRTKYDFECDTAKIYILSRSGLNEIKNHINYLSQEVEKSCKLSEDTLNNDIDRLNTFMAWGIGFLAIIGALAPFIMNILFRDDIKSEMESIKTKITGYDEKVDLRLSSHNESISNSLKQYDEKITNQNKIITQIDSLIKEISTSITDIQPIINPIKSVIEKYPETEEKLKIIESDLNEKTPIVSLLILQNNISRLYNVSKLDELVRQRRFNFFSDIFQNIRSSFENCKLLNVQIDKHFTLILGDFYDNLKATKLSLYLFDKNQSLVSELCESLLHLKKNETLPLDQRYSELLSKFDNVIQYLNSKNN